MSRSSKNRMFRHLSLRGELSNARRVLFQRAECNPLTCTFYPYSGWYVGTLESINKKGLSIFTTPAVTEKITGCWRSTYCALWVSPFIILWRTVWPLAPRDLKRLKEQCSISLPGQSSELKLHTLEYNRCCSALLRTVLSVPHLSFPYH